MNNIESFLNNINDSIPEGISLINKFFFTFSRFECALKNTPGYLKGGRYAEPDWSAFEKSIRDHFKMDFSKKITESVDYILSDPPRKQINNDGVLAWRESRLDDNAPTTQKLVEYIKRVRNNLLHGGKYNGIYTNESRNYKLINYSIFLLDYFLELNTEVKANFLININ